MKQLLFLPVLLFCNHLFPQDTSSMQHQASNNSFTKHKGRIYLATAGSAVAYGTALTALSNAWYSNYPQTSFHFFDDGNDWLQVDKAGHAFSAYTAGKTSMELWRWAGLPRKQRIWIGGLSGTAFLTVVEVLDGFSTGWGFSGSDLAANLAGSGLLIAQELAWNEQRVQLKFSFHRKDYATLALNQRADGLFGRTATERMLKDYNGQTYWVSMNLASFFKESVLPKWLNIAAGYGADGMLGGTENVSKDDNGNIVFDRRDIIRYRQWYLSPDIDLTKIKTKSRLLRASLFLLNSFKFPFPALAFSRNGIEWNWLYF